MMTYSSRLLEQFPAINPDTILIESRFNFISSHAYTTFK